MRKIAVPANRYTPLKESWMKIFTPVVEHLKLQIRFNLKTRHVELRVSDILLSQLHVDGVEFEQEQLCDLAYVHFHLSSDLSSCLF